MLVKIESDPLYIAERLREIDESYYIVYNTDRSCYEVHSNAQKGGTFCFGVKDNALDARVIDYALKTRSDKADEIIAALDKENERLALSLARGAIEKIQEGLC